MDTIFSLVGLIYYNACTKHSFILLSASRWHPRTGRFIADPNRYWDNFNKIAFHQIVFFTNIEKYTNTTVRQVLEPDQMSAPMLVTNAIIALGVRNEKKYDNQSHPVASKFYKISKVKNKQMEIII